MSALDIAIGLLVLAALVGAGWTARGLYRTLRGDDYRTRNDRRQAWLAACAGRPEPGTPGSDNDLLLDAQLAYYGPALDQTRREDR